MAARKPKFPEPAAKAMVSELAAGKIIVLTARQWEERAPEFPEVSRTPTGMGAPILLVRRSVPGRKILGWALVEESKPAERVIRPMASRKEAQTLISERLAAYERMWDG